MSPLTKAADPTAALVEFLITELPAITGSTVAAGLKVFRPDLPRGEQAFMPAACVVVTPGGGSSLHGGDFLPLGSPLIDFYCYGASHLQADNVGREVALRLKELRRAVYRDPSRNEGVCLNWARLVAEPKTMVDSETLWPLCLVTAQVSYFLTSTGAA